MELLFRQFEQSVATSGPDTITRWGLMATWHVGACREGELARNWEGIWSSNGSDVLGVAGQRDGVAFSASPTIDR